MNQENTTLSVMDRIDRFGLVPVIKLEDAAQAVPLADALCRGGLPVAEVTFRTAAAAESIRRIRAAHPEMLVGAGTVTSVEMAQQALDAGAEFLVGPGFNRAVVEFCLAKGVTVLPGCSSPTDMETALGYGFTTVKFFPAEASGGLAALKAMAAPFGSLRFMPTGGIDLKNLKDYLSFDQVVACGGSWLVKEDLIAAGDFAAIERLTAEAVSEVLGLELAHIGIDMDTPEEAGSLASRFSKLLGTATRELPGAIFVGTGIEILKKRSTDPHGHIAIRTANVARAVDWLTRQGLEVDPAREVKDAKGKTRLVFLKESFGGFGVHLTQK